MSTTNRPCPHRSTTNQHCPHRSTTNRLCPHRSNPSRRFLSPRGPNRCLRIYVLVPNTVHPTDTGVGRVNIRCRLIQGHPLLWLQVDLPLTGTIPIRSGQGNILVLRVMGTIYRTRLLVKAILLPDLRILHRGTPRTRMYLNPRRPVTRGQDISRPHTLRLIRRRQSQRLTIVSRAGLVTVHLSTARLDTAHLKYPPRRFQYMLEPRASRLYRHNPPPRTSTHRSRPRRILFRSRLTLLPNLDIHSHSLLIHSRNLLILRHPSRGILFKHRPNSRYINNRSIFNLKVRTARTTIPPLLWGHHIGRSSQGRTPLENYRILLWCTDIPHRYRFRMMGNHHEATLHSPFHLYRLWHPHRIRLRARIARAQSTRGSWGGGGSKRKGMRSLQGSWISN